MHVQALHKSGEAVQPSVRYTLIFYEMLLSPLDVVCRIIWLLVVRWPGIIFYVSICMAVPVQTRVVVGARRYFVLGA